MKFRFLVSGNSSRNIWKNIEQKQITAIQWPRPPPAKAGPGRGPIGATRRPRMNVSELSQIFDPRPARHCVFIDHGTEGHRRVAGSFTLGVEAKRVQDVKGRIDFPRLAEDFRLSC